MVGFLTFQSMSISDNVLVAVSYYIGHEKEFTGEFPFAVLVYVTASCMVTSEIIATRKKRKINPQKSTKCQGNQGKKMVIFNLIPFTRLNLIFAFSAMITAIIRILQNTQKGVPNLSIQIVVMLLCLLATNNEAKLHFKRKYVALRGTDMEAMESYHCEISRRKKDSEIKETAPQVLYESPKLRSPMACLHADIDSIQTEATPHFETTFVQTESPTFTYVYETVRQGPQDIFQTWQPPNVTMFQQHTNKF